MFFLFSLFGENVNKCLLVDIYKWIIINIIYNEIYIKINYRPHILKIRMHYAIKIIHLHKK